MRKFIRILLAAAAALLLAGCAKSEDPGLIRVMLEAGDGFTVEGDNPVFITPGQDAVFKIDLPEGGICIQTGGGAVWDETAQTLTLPAAKYPATVSMRTGTNPNKVKFYVEHAGKPGGYIGADIEQGFVYEGSVANIYANPNESHNFVAWTKNRSLANGGEVLSNDEKFTYTVDGTSVIYANFEKKPDTGAGIDILSVQPKGNVTTRIFTYNANGGVYAGTGKPIFATEVGEYHIFQNCLPAKDYFVREGYQLIEYNTKPDGSGEAYSLGARIVDNTDNPVVLYCIWAKESDPANFVTVEVEGGLAIKEYTADEKTLVIPETIGGRKVITLYANAFVNKSFETVVIPKSVTWVDTQTFVNCKNFTTLYLFDTVLNIFNNSFTDISNFKNFRLNAAMDPRYTNTGEGGQTKKWERLVNAKLEGKKVLAVFSGSSSMTGLDSAMLQEYLDNEYVVVNYGTRTSNCGIFYMEAISHWLTEGDVIIHAPELFATMLGQDKFYWYVFRMIEYNYNILRYVDISHYSNYFATLTEFNSYRVKAKALDYTYQVPLNEYGDGNNSGKTYNKDDVKFGNTVTLDPNIINGVNRENLNRTYRMMLDKGAKVYFSCAPCNINNVPAQYKNDEAMDKFMEGIRNSVDATVISHIKDYAIGGKYMRDHTYHVNIYGREVRTQQLCKDIKGSWSGKVL